MLKFKETVTIELKGDSCIIRCGTKEYTIKDDKEVYYNKFKRRMWSSGSLTDEEIQFLTSNNLVVKEYINNYLNTEFEKNIYFFEDLSENLQISPNDIQKSIFEKNIVILGCGGVGTVVLKNLLAFGVKKFILIDYDKVEISNLNRQLFYTRNDVGERKVDVFSRKIEEEFKEVEVITLADKVASKKIEKLNKYKCDNIVLCADKPCDISNIVSKYAKKISAAVFSGYVGIVTGTWGSTLNSYEDLHKKCTTSTLSEGINLWNFIPENNNFLFKKSTIATIKCLSPDYYPNNIICNYISKYLTHYNIEVNWVMRPLKEYIEELSNATEEYQIIIQLLSPVVNSDLELFISLISFFNIKFKKYYLKMINIYNKNKEELLKLEILKYIQKYSNIFILGNINHIFLKDKELEFLKIDEDDYYYFNLNRGE